LTSLPLLVVDVLGIVLCYLVGAIAAYVIVGKKLYYPGLWNNLFAASFCHFIVGNILGLYPASGMNPVVELRKHVTSIGVSLLLVLALNGLVGEVTSNEAISIGVAFPLSVVLAPVARFTTRKLFATVSWWGERVIVVGAGHQGRLVFEFLEKLPQRGLKPLGMVDDHPAEYWMSEKSSPFEFLGTTADLVNICRDRHCHWVIAAVADKTEDQVRQILTRGSLIPNFVVLYSNMMLPTMWVESFDAAGLAGVHIKDRLLFPFQRLAKRLFDIVLAATVLLLCSPLLLVVGCWIKLASPGPVFFQHHGRIGRGGRTFGAYKIRTMVRNAEQILEQHLAASPEAREEWIKDQKLKNDPRIIPGVGHILRRTSLDELPQLFNIILGDMSLVGPRPIYTDNEIGKFRELYPLYLRVRPGLTGLWQVSGRNNTSYEDRVRLDSYYVRNWSVWLDYFIILRTIRTVLLREGSY
jgi:Undecaprenyl-phosphate galactose phosphotransferase WbaP